jgi:hypothetical protein
MSKPLEGKVAHVAAATCGARRGPAIALGEAGATVGSFSSGELARDHALTDVDGSQTDCWRYLVEA